MGWIPIPGASDHGALTGLGDDDHTTYVPTDGSRQFTKVDVSGLTGATSASRYVGATTSGAPASGTFAVGDFVITQDGNVFVCTTAGSPGTWTEVGAGATTDADAIHDNVAGEIAAVTEKTSPVSADLVLIEDSEAANAKKRVQVGNLPGGGGGGGSTVPQWIERLAAPATSDGSDDEYDDASVGGTTVTVTGAQTITEQDGRLSIDVTSAIAAGDINCQLIARTMSVGDIIETAATVMSGEDDGGLTFFGCVLTDGTTATSNVAYGHARVRTTEPGQLQLVPWGGTLTSVNNVSGTIEVLNYFAPVVWLRLEYVATDTFRVYVSPDGISWKTFGGDITVSFTPTHFGVGWSTWGGTDIRVVSFEYVRVV